MPHGADLLPRRQRTSRLPVPAANTIAGHYIGQRKRDHAPLSRLASIVDTSRARLMQCDLCRYECVMMHGAPCSCEPRYSVPHMSQTSILRSSLMCAALLLSPKVRH